MYKPLLLLVKDTTREKIENEEIAFVSVKDKYVLVTLIDKRKFTVRTSLRRFEKSLPPDLFFRIHKNHIVCLQHIRYIDTEVIMKTGDPLPISRELKEALLSNFEVF
ncbi:LytTr DNA-binding domain-containing protein [Chitinophaga sp. YR627]|uniref:LytR/AlgR family response regulator transcription factor n=1 Tax=Chitinophaga sp. YR627 TaxID=1881041 RepID=UPI0008F1E0BC|nr:LytTr DNA-binding domain-containing protein [Chitinophaga sp. YR627]